MKGKQKEVKHVTNRFRIDGCTPENMIFACRIPSKSIKTFISIIKAVMGATNAIDSAELQMSKTGIKYIVEESKSFQVLTYIKKNFFEEFSLKIVDPEEPVSSVGVNLKSFTDILSGILSEDFDGMNMVYYKNIETISFSCNQVDSYDPLKEKIDLIDDDIDDEDKNQEPIEIIIEHFVRTMHSMNPVDFDTMAKDILNSVIINANDFHGIINDFDRSVNEVEIKITEKEMSIKSLGILQYEARFKTDAKSEIFFSYECDKPSKFIYKFNHIKAMLKSLQMCSQVSMTTYSDGLLRTMLKVTNPDDETSSAFIEYNMLSSLPEDDDDDNVEIQ